MRIVRLECPAPLLLEWLKKTRSNPAAPMFARPHVGFTGERKGIMSRILVPLFVLMCTTASFGQDVYFVIRSSGGTNIGIAKVNADGSGFAVVVAADDIAAWMNALIPGATGSQFTGEYFVDSVNHALYLVGRYQDVTLGTLPALLRSNLDGTFMELVSAPAPPTISGGDIFVSPQVLQSSAFRDDSDGCVGQRLDDPGFEAEGAGWEKVNNGGRSVVGTPVHSGARSLQMLVHHNVA